MLNIIEFYTNRDMVEIRNKMPVQRKKQQLKKVKLEE
jgi:hypothetical protein